MNKIRNSADLALERKRLEEKLRLQKEAVRQDLHELREELQPAIGLMSMLGKITKKTTSNPLLIAGASLAADLLLANTVFSKSARITRTVLPFLISKVTSLFTQNTTGGNIFQRLAGKLKRKSNGHLSEL